jgi:magnesium transporter
MQESEQPKRAVTDLRSVHDPLSAWHRLEPVERTFAFGLLPRYDAEELFLKLASEFQADLISHLPENERRLWIRLLSPEDAAHLIEELPDISKQSALDLIDDHTRREVQVFLAYAEDRAGGLMDAKFARLRPDMTVDEAISYLRVQARAHLETIYYAYVLDPNQTLLGVVSFRELFVAPEGTRVRDIMTSRPVSVLEDLDQEQVAHIASENKFLALPVVNAKGQMKGIVPIDETMRVVSEEATEDIQKLGGMEALDAPYFQIGLLNMIKKRAGWLLILFVGEMFTATAMGYFQREIERAVVLALFIPLIISSGGNSGSQATTLIIRAMALGEVKLKDIFRVFLRESCSGLFLGCILGSVGLFRILLWPARQTLYGAHYVLISLTVCLSLVGIVLWGTLMGSMLPFILKRLGFDPASASAPFVATLVDVTGLIIYFSVASIVLRGTLL